MKIPTLTADQMRRVDEIAVANGLGVSQMMELAGAAMASLVRELHPGKSVLVLAGKGNNGGDGLNAAKHLLNWGFDMCVVLAYPSEELNGVSKKQLTVLRYAGADVSVFSGSLPACDVIVDALIGYALKGDPRPPIADMIRAANESGADIVAFDNPSGLDVTTGERRDPCVDAVETLTLALPKTGMNTENSGEIYLADIGVPARVYEELGIAVPDMFSEKNILRL